MQLAGVGFSQRRIATALRRGWLVRLHRGAYALSERWTSASPSVRHCLRLLVVQAAAPDAVGIGLTAAVAWGWPVRTVPDLPVVARDVSLGRQIAGATVRRLQLNPERAVDRRGLLVTTREITALDVAGGVPFVDALVTVDAALRSGVSLDSVQQLIDGGSPSPHGRRAIPVLTAGDPASESALESTSRGCMIVGGMPLPLCNVVIRVGGRWFRVDFLWVEFGVVGESDGRTKYRDSESVSDVIWREKRRHEQIEEWGFRIARWGAPELANGAAAMLLRIEQAMYAQRRLGFAWPDGVRAEMPVRRGVRPPPHVIAEVNRLRGLGYPISFVDEWGNSLPQLDDYLRFLAS